MNLFVALFLCLISFVAFADDPGGQTVYIRIVDTGSGLCTITRMPGPHYMIYDTGHWNNDQICAAAVKRIVSAGHSIDLLIQSHSDADHVAATDEILDTYAVKRVIRTGYTRWDKAAWRDAYWAIRRQRNAGTLMDVNVWGLPDKMLQPGFTSSFGDVDIVQIAGFNNPPLEWRLFAPSKRRNSVSIVIQLKYAGRAVLFSGDAVGRLDGDDCVATEKFMVDNSAQVPIKSEVLIAPHHGADNASSDCFIDAVDPTWVIFSAGHAHHHPREATAQRYINHGVSVSNMFRTDLGDNEGGPEWSHGSGGGDQPGDDDVEIIIDDSGNVEVRYDN